MTGHLRKKLRRNSDGYLKIFFLGTAGLVGYQFFPYMGTGSSSFWVGLSA
jgi:hypothetical protein